MKYGPNLHPRRLRRSYSGSRLGSFHPCAFRSPNGPMSTPGYRPKRPHRWAAGIPSPTSGNRPMRSRRIRPMNPWCSCGLPRWASRNYS